MQLRGGSSKGVYFDADDLPGDIQARDQVLLDAMGRDKRQIDGLGGGNPLTSKVGIVSYSKDPQTDIDYLFAQIVVGEERVDVSPNCGNILAGAGAFAIETGMIKTQDPKTVICVNMVNSGNRCELIMQTPGGKLEYDGDVQIDGVPGTAAPVVCNYLDLAGSACGSLLPTGNTIDTINGVPVTCIDNGMPVVVLPANALAKSGYESIEELNNDLVFREKLEAIRLQAGSIMNLDDVTHKVIPKMSLIAPPKAGGHVCTRTFIPHVCHSAIGVLGAVSVATACVLSDSVAQGIAKIPDGDVKQMSVEHPSGEFSIELAFDTKGSVTKAGVMRTTRLLSKGHLYVRNV